MTVTYTTRTIGTDAATVSLTTDDRTSGHTVYTLRIRSTGSSECIAVGKNSADFSAKRVDEFEVSFHYGFEGGAVIDALWELFK